MALAISHATSLTGDKELIRKLNALPSAVYKKVIRQASNKAWTPVLKRAKQLAPRETGLLKKSLGRKQKTYPVRNLVVTAVGPLTGKGKKVTVNTPTGEKTTFRDPVHYAHLVERGTAPHTIKTKRGTWEHPGSPAKPFLRPAFDANVSLAVSIMRSEIAKGVEREAKKRVITP